MARRIHPTLAAATLLLALLTFPFPVWGQDSKGVGVVTALSGKADLKRPQAPQAPLKLRDNLLVRDVVDTHRESVARILLMGKSTGTVRELSRFEIREEVLPDGGHRALINLASGKIRVMVARRLMKPGDAVEIRTPNAVASVRGSDGVIEVSTLPDGRPLTVISAVSGEFQVSLPTTPPFIARGLEFFDGPVHAGGGPLRGAPVIAMAQTASDAGSWLQLAQASFIVTGGFQGQSAGPAGAQTWAQIPMTPGMMTGVTSGLNISLGGSGTGTPSNANDNTLNTTGEVAVNIVAQILGGAPTLAPSPVDTSGATTGGGTGGGGGLGPSVYDPCQGGGCQPSSPPPAPPPTTTELFVDASTGSDLNTGSSFDDPFQTITKALSVANPGTTIQVASGTYTESLTAKSEVSVESLEGANQTFIVPSSPAVSGNNVSNFTLGGLTAAGTQGSPAVSFTGNSNFTLQDNVFLSHGDGVVLSGPTGVLAGAIAILRNRIAAGTAGVALNGTLNTALSVGDNVITSLHDRAIRLDGTYQASVGITNNDLWAATDAIRLGGTFPGSLTIQANDIWAGEEAIAGTLTGTITNNEIWAAHANPALTAGNEVWAGNVNSTTFTDLRVERKGNISGNVPVSGKLIRDDKEGILIDGKVTGGVSLTDNRIRSDEKAAVRINGTVLGTITIDGNRLWADKKEGIRLDGNLKGVSISENRIWADKMEGIELKGSIGGVVTIDGNRVWAEEAGLRLDGSFSEQVNLQSNIIRSAKKEAIELGGDDTYKKAVTITGNVLMAKKEGIKLDGTFKSTVTISANTVQAGKEGIKLSGDDTYQGAVTISDNRIVAEKAGIKLDGTFKSPVTISNNTVLADDDGIELKGHFQGNVLIADNTVSAGTGASGIDTAGAILEMGAQLTLTNNTVTNHTGVQLTGSSIFSGNRVTSETDGVRWAPGASPQISNNTITAGRHGLLWDAPDAPSITAIRPGDIDVTPPAPSGTWATSQDTPLISDNVVRSSLASFTSNPALANVGVFVGANAIIRNNTISGFNIGIIAGGNALIQGNTITGNQIGILVASGSPVIQANIIQNNAITGVKILPNLGTILALGNTWNSNVQGTNAAGRFTETRTVTGPVTGTNFIIGAGSAVRLGP